ncbi:THO complex subunit 5 [Rhizoclosmatium sp. JEL0117]|nr:THO complex subunit 5 [Rhizoclosmatium sp. JEL0117]
MTLEGEQEQEGAHDVLILALRRAAEQVHSSLKASSSSSISSSSSSASSSSSTRPPPPPPLPPSSLVQQQQQPPVQPPTSIASKYARPQPSSSSSSTSNNSNQQSTHQHQLHNTNTNNNNNNQKTPLTPANQRALDAAKTPFAAAVAEADAAFAELLSKTRSKLAQTRAAKSATTDAKHRLDQAVLKEKSWKYERDHLRRLIAKMRAHEYIYNDIQLHDIDDFLAKAKPSVSSSSSSTVKKRRIDDTSDVNGIMEDDDGVIHVDDMDTTVDEIEEGQDNDDLTVYTNEHQLMLNRLQFELRERKRLKTSQDALTAQKLLLLKQNETKRIELESVDRDLESLLKATLPLQERLHVTVTKSRVEAADAQALPRPLFVLYQQVLDWNDLKKDDPIKLEIINKSQQQPNGIATTPSMMDVDNPTTNSPNSKKPATPSPTSSYNKPHDYSLKLTLPLPQPTIQPSTTTTPPQKHITLHFHHLPKQQIVILEPVSTSTQQQQTTTTTTTPMNQPHVSQTFTLHALFHGDTTGIDSPNPASAARFNAKEAGGLAYHWVQRICGLYFPGMAELADDDCGGDRDGNDGGAAVAGVMMRGLVERVVQGVRRRFMALEEVGRGLSGAVSGRLPVAVNAVSTGAGVGVGVGVGAGGARVVGWKDVKDDEGDCCVKGMVTVEVRGAQLGAKKRRVVFLCELGWRYPDVAAKFSFVQEEEVGGAGDIVLEPSETVNDILQIVNGKAHDLVDAYVDGKQNLVAVYQLAKLVACLGAASAAIGSKVIFDNVY